MTAPRLAMRACTSAAVIVALGSASAMAQQRVETFPSRPVRLIVPNLPASGPDNVARLLAPKLAEAWGHQVVIDNRPGATGLIAADLFARAAADGHTLWLITLTHLIATLQAQRHMLARDFAPVSYIGSTPFVVVVNAALPVKSVAELIEYAKSRPGQLTYGSGGQWGSPHLCMEVFKAATGIDMLHVPYKGSPQALADIAGGRVDAACIAAPSLPPAFMQTGKVRSIGVTSLVPTRLAPGVPPVAETVSGFELPGWYGLQAPLRTPQHLIERISVDVSKALKTRELEEQMIAAGAEPAGSSPQAFGAFLQKETVRWEKVLRQLGGLKFPERTE